MEEEAVPTIEELKKLKVVDLKTRLASLGLQISGLKADLVARLHSYFVSAQHTQQPEPAQVEERQSEHHEEFKMEHDNDSAPTAMAADIEEISVDKSVLEHVATIAEQAKSSMPKKRRRRVNEMSGRQKALKRLRKEQEAGLDAEECEIVFGKKNWPPPFEDTVLNLRSSLMKFSKKTKGWTKEDMAELRVYFTRKWKVPSSHQAMLTWHFRVAATSQRCFIAARKIMDNHKEKHANLGKSVLRREVRPNLFSFITGLCPIDDEETLYEKLKNVAEGKSITGVSSQPSPAVKGPGRYEKLKMEYDNLRAEKVKLARINAQLVKTISSLTELLQDRSLTSETPCYEDPPDIELAEEVVQEEEEEATLEEDQLIELEESPSICDQKEEITCS